MTTSQLTGGTYSGTIEYLESPVFIFSPAPLVVTLPDAPDGFEVTLLIAGRNVYGPPTANYSETRSVRAGKAYFEISRILQHLSAVAPADVFDASRAPAGAYTTYSMRLHEGPDTSGNIIFDYSGSLRLIGILGALDQDETYAYGTRPESPLTRRLWLNYPQTFSIAQNAVANQAYVLPDPLEQRDGFWFLADLSGASSFSSPVLAEIDIMERLREVPSSDYTYESAQKTLSKLQKGRAATVGLSTRCSVSPEGHNNGESASGIEGLTAQYIRLKPDNTARGTGTYLRWLHRDGSFGYWHFQNGDLTTAASEGNTFQRTILSNPAEVQEGRFLNPASADFSESRTLSLSTYVDDDSEYEYLLGLATSPVVDRMLEQDNGTFVWQRVNIAPGSYTRSRKRLTPRRSAFDITIILPQRNTIKL